MTSTGQSVVRIGRTGDGLLVRIEGRGTMRESTAFHDFIVNSLKCEQLALAIDLTDCEYLDSTFLGCLVKLHQQLSGNGRKRFSVVAPPQRVKQLLAPMCLDKLLDITATSPAVGGPMTSIPVESLTSNSLGQHAIECHRKLAALGGPNQEIFENLANKLERELNGKA